MKGRVVDLSSLGHPAVAVTTVSEEVPGLAHLTISQMALLYDVSLRILRFYEDRGLIKPIRDGNARLYRAADRKRLEMILRGKKLGFTLSEISDLISGLPFSRGALYHLLQNPIYRGMIVHKDKAYPGEHPAILDQDLWDAFQRKLRANGVERNDGRKSEASAILTGVLFDAAGGPMTPTHAVKKGVRYRYYVSRHLVTGARSEDPGQRLPAPGIEKLVVARLRAFLADPSAVDDALPEDRRDAPRRKRAAAAAADLIQVLDDPSNPSREPFLCAVLCRVQVGPENVEIQMDRRRVAAALTDDRRAPGTPIFQGPAAATSRSDFLAADAAGNVESDSGDPRPIRLAVPARLKRRGNEMKFVVEGGANGEDPRIDESLVRLIVRARILAQRFQDNPAATIEGIAAAEGFGPTYAGRLLRLTSLAPDIVAAILDGGQPPELTANVLMADTRLPLEWSAQRAMLGFPAKVVTA